MADPTLEAAARMKTALGETTELLLIGALAMAAHGYARQTTDIDFAVAASVRDLPEWVKRLEAAGLAAEYSPPDAEDPSRPVPTQGDGSLAFSQAITAIDLVVGVAPTYCQLNCQQALPLRRRKGRAPRGVPLHALDQVCVPALSEAHSVNQAVFRDLHLDPFVEERANFLR